MTRIGGDLKLKDEDLWGNNLHAKQAVQMLDTSKIIIKAGLA